MRGADLHQVGIEVLGAPKRVRCAHCNSRFRSAGTLGWPTAFRGSRIRLRL